MKPFFRCVFRIFSREFRALPAADPAAPFLRFAIYVWGAMFVIVYAIPFVLVEMALVPRGSGHYQAYLPGIFRAVGVCAGLAALLPVFGALRHWRTESPCARALRAVALHQAACLVCLAPMALFILIAELAGLELSGLAAELPVLVLFAPQILHWYSFGIYFLPGLILIVAGHVAGCGSLPGWRLPALALFLAVASSAPVIAWFFYF